jgi:hypothetical protein
VTSRRHWRAFVGSTVVAIALAIGLLSTAAGAAQPALTLTASDAIVGQTIHASAQLTESPGASEEISFEVFGSADPTCSGPALAPAPGSVPVSGEGEYLSGNFTPPAAGTYYWSAHYPGDSENLPAESICSAISTVGKASPGMTGNASDAAVGTGVHDQATVSGGFSPTGEVTFSIYGPADGGCSTPLGTSTAPIQSGQATSADYFPLEAGKFRWTATYPGDANNEPTSLVCGSANQTSAVAKAAPTLSAAATAAVVVGQTIGDSATLSGGFSAGGELVFRAYGPGDQTCSGAVKYEATVAVAGDGAYSPAGFAPGPGLYRWTVTYSGDASNGAVSLGCGAANQSSTVAKAAPNLSGSATSTVVVGQTITDNATLSGGFSAGGELVFRAYGPGDQTCSGAVKYQATVAVNGDGTYSPPGFAPGPGPYLWTVAYPGDANNDAASLGCGSANQASTVNKAAPSLSGTATSAVVVEKTITDNATLSGGFNAGGDLVFRAYGPSDPTCSGAVKYQATVAVNGDGTYSPGGFEPGPGLYQWTVEYTGDADNDAVLLGCGSTNQGSAVGTIPVTLAAGATDGTVGTPVTATATIQEGAIPSGQISFKAFPPADVNCSGPPAFTSVVSIAGNGPHRSAAFVPPRVGSFRWSASYSGDLNHTPATAGCGKATSTISQAAPTIGGAVSQRLTVGTSFRDTATLQGGYAPTGTITFRIYGPVAAGCAKPLFVDTVAVTGNGTVSSDPFVAQRPGRYSFVASYSGDTANRSATEPCDSAAQVAQVQKRAPKVKPRARVMKGKQISIRARLSGGASPSGVINFRLYRPGDKRCKGKPAFSGGITINANGSYSLATYLATQPGTYRLSVGYSGDRRNKRFRAGCSGAQPLRVT